MSSPQVRLQNATQRLQELEASATYASDRYRLYRARVSGPHPTSVARLKELDRAAVIAERMFLEARRKHRMAEAITEGDTMESTVTEEQLVTAAKQLDQDEFTRADLAAKLGVEKPDLKQAFISARKAGRLEKVRVDEDNTRHFRLL